MRIIGKKGEGWGSPSIQTSQSNTQSNSIYTHKHTCFYALISHHSPSPTSPLGPLRDFHCNLHAGERGDNLKKSTNWHPFALQRKREREKKRKRKRKREKEQLAEI